MYFLLHNVNVSDSLPYDNFFITPVYKFLASKLWALCIRSRYNNCILLHVRDVETAKCDTENTKNERKNGEHVIYIYKIYL